MSPILEAYKDSHLVIFKAFSFIPSEAGAFFLSLFSLYLIYYFIGHLFKFPERIRSVSFFFGTYIFSAFEILVLQSSQFKNSKIESRQLVDFLVLSFASANLFSVLLLQSNFEQDIIALSMAKHCAFVLGLYCFHKIRPIDYGNITISMTRKSSILSIVFISLYFVAVVKFMLPELLKSDMCKETLVDWPSLMAFACTEKVIDVSSFSIMNIYNRLSFFNVFTVVGLSGLSIIQYKKINGTFHKILAYSIGVFLILNFIFQSMFYSIRYL